MTIYEEFGHFEGLKVAIAGDLDHSRVAKSNMQILKRLGAELYFAGPEEWRSQEFADYGQFVTIDEIIDQVDVLDVSPYCNMNAMIVEQSFQRRLPCPNMA